MKINMKVITNIRTKEVINKVNDATGKALVTVVAAIANDAIKGSPYLTGNNRRSIRYEVGPGGEVAKDKGEGAVYGTSGYSGWLEVGTCFLSARPYFRPALDLNIHKLPEGIKTNLS